MIATFVPVDKDDAPASKKAAPEGVGMFLPFVSGMHSFIFIAANKFNKATGASEKCAACGKTVYLTEKIVVEDKEDKQTFHKACLRCSHCQVLPSLLFFIL